MRIAVVSDIHGNRAALDAVLADLKKTAPDLVLHGGDLAHGGAHAAECVDCVRGLGWRGVLGNTDEMLFRPESLTEFAAESPAAYQPLFTAIAEMAAVTRETLGGERLAWLEGLPRTLEHDAIVLIHASPESLWRAPAPEASGDELESVYGVLERAMVVYGHIHRQSIRRTAKMTVVNSGSVSLSYDGDRRASYLLLDGMTPQIRRVEYDVEREIEDLGSSGLPHAGWVARQLAKAGFEMP
jgi:putative phosphoesterase